MRQSSIWCTPSLKEVKLRLERWSFSMHMVSLIDTYDPFLLQTIVKVIWSIWVLHDINGKIGLLLLYLSLSINWIGYQPKWTSVQSQWGIQTIRPTWSIVWAYSTGISEFISTAKQLFADQQFDWQWLQTRFKLFMRWFTLELNHRFIAAHCPDGKHVSLVKMFLLFRESMTSSASRMLSFKD